MMDFDLVRRNHQSKWKPEHRFRGTLLALDPGHTTGCAIFQASFEEATLKASMELETWPLEGAVENLTKVFDVHKPDIIVFERYGIYSWKTEQHANSEVPTIQVVGCLKTLAIQRGTRYYSQTAQTAKGFCTDEKLTAWNFYKPGQRHARDAIRHAVFFLLFGPSRAQG